MDTPNILLPQYAAGWIPYPARITPRRPIEVEGPLVLGRCTAVAAPGARRPAPTMVAALPLFAPCRNHSGEA
jgi:hypothetical protein